jgi:hypothetical protein
VRTSNPTTPIQISWRSVQGFLSHCLQRDGQTGRDRLSEANRCILQLLLWIFQKQLYGLTRARSVVLSEHLCQLVTI